jgi:hypothetical protein
MVREVIEEQRGTAPPRVIEGEPELASVADR